MTRFASYPYFNKFKFSFHSTHAYARTLVRLSYILLQIEVFFFEYREISEIAYDQRSIEAFALSITPVFPNISSTFVIEGYGFGESLRKMNCRWVEGVERIGGSEANFFFSLRFFWSRQETSTKCKKNVSWLNIAAICDLYPICKSTSFSDFQKFCIPKNLILYDFLAKAV